MVDKLNYNQIKLLRFIASIFLICIYILNFFVRSYLLEILRIIALLVYVFLLTRYNDKNKNVTDDLIKQNETKIAQFISLLMISVLFVALLFSNLVEILFYIMVAVYSVKDGYYLYLERRTGKKADAENKIKDCPKPN